MTTLLDGFIDRRTLCDDLDVSPRTIARYERQPDGLPYTEVGGRKLYRVASVLAWLASRERHPNPRRRAA